MSVRRNMNVAKTSAPTSDTAESEFVKKVFLNASRMMKESGFGIKGDVKIAIDPKLPFMGYSMPLGKGYRIVVSGGSVGSGMLEGLIVHEMSHIYRMENNHVSHDAEVIQQSIERIDTKRLSDDYQQKIVHDLLNDIQDLYADDISIMVHNARALGQMTRHRIKDTGGKAAESNRKFLSRMPPTASIQFPFFQDLMINL